jgi:formamidopyrimidine-DNA glycosylase
MTGKWVRRAADEAPAPWVRASITLDDGNALDYRDMRLFGRLIRGTTDQLRRSQTLGALGPDPLAGIDVERLQAIFARTKRSMKEALMDQRTLAGLGNIQVSESLHRAGIDPQRPALSMTMEETARLADAIGASLRATLRDEDSPEPITYVEEGGENVFLVYDRAGQPCATCGTPIERIVQGGRSTYYCPTCQPRWKKRGTSRTGPSRPPAGESVARARAAKKATRRPPARRLRVVQGQHAPARGR